MPHLIPVLTILFMVGALACLLVYRSSRQRLPGKAAYALRHSRHFKGGMLCCHLCGETDIGIDEKRSAASYKVYACRRCTTALWRDKAG